MDWLSARALLPGWLQLLVSLPEGACLARGVEQVFF